MTMSHDVVKETAAKPGYKGIAVRAGAMALFGIGIWRGVVFGVDIGTSMGAHSQADSYQRQAATLNAEGRLSAAIRAYGLAEDYYGQAKQQGGMIVPDMLEAATNIVVGGAMFESRKNGQSRLQGIDPAAANPIAAELTGPKNYYPVYDPNTRSFKMPDGYLTGGSSHVVELPEGASE